MSRNNWGSAGLSAAMVLVSLAFLVISVATETGSLILAVSIAMMMVPFKSLFVAEQLADVFAASAIVPAVRLMVDPVHLRGLGLRVEDGV